LCGKEFQPLDVVGVVVWVCPVLLAVVLDADFPFRPAHVDAAPADLDLGDGSRQSVAHQQQAQLGLLRRFRTIVGKIQRVAKSADAARTGIAVGDPLDILDRTPRGVEKRVDPDDCPIA
jgi:hypothetical protein